MVSLSEHQKDQRKHKQTLGEGDFTLRSGFEGQGGAVSLSIETQEGQRDQGEGLGANLGQNPIDDTHSERRDGDNGSGSGRERGRRHVPGMLSHPDRDKELSSAPRAQQPQHFSRA
ncbi:hypothetical protein AGIG_G7746 [Arapaima gigas]